LVWAVVNARLHPTAAPAMAESVAP
jgi:hypothetical protein